LKVFAIVKIAIECFENFGGGGKCPKCPPGCAPDLGYGRHGTCHGRHFDGDAKLLGKNCNFYLQFLKLLFCSPPTINCNAASTQRQSLMQGKNCARTIKYYDKTMLLWLPRFRQENLSQNLVETSLSP